MKFNSWITDLGLLPLPEYRSKRIMMMPFRVEDPLFTLPGSLGDWRETVDLMLWMYDDGDREPGIGYLTIDEAVLAKGETHRRPGLHVDGIGEDGSSDGAWGGGGTWGSRGFLMTSSHVGCQAWEQSFEAGLLPNGDCEPLRDQCQEETRRVLNGGRLYACPGLCVHEAVPMEKTTKRQFVRISMPSDGPWYEGYTPNPLGIQPAGPIRPARTEFMNQRR
jgi:hypothetical protein